MIIYYHFPHIWPYFPLWICHAQRWIWGDIIWTMTLSRCGTRVGHRSNRSPKLWSSGSEFSTYDTPWYTEWGFFSGDPKKIKKWSPNISDFSGDQEIWTIMILWSIQKCILKWIWSPAGHQTIVVSSFFVASSSGPWFQAKKEEKESLAEAARLSKEAGSQGWRKRW